MQPRTDPVPPVRVRRIALLGGESSGKTTLARALAERLGAPWVPEYGRQRWEELRTTLSEHDLVHVARTQVKWEDEHKASNSGWLVCDTTPLTTLQYCLHDHGRSPSELHELARRRYDVTVVCQPDFDFVQDGCRRDDAFRAEQHRWTLARLRELGVEPLIVHGSVQARLAQVLDHLDHLAQRVRPDPLAAETERTGAGLPHNPFHEWAAKVDSTEPDHGLPNAKATLR